MFWTRLFSGIVLLIIAIGSIGIGGPLLTAVLLFVSLVGYRELTKALQVTAQSRNTAAENAIPQKAAARITAIEATGMAGTVLYYLLLQLDAWAAQGVISWKIPESVSLPVFGIVLVFLAELFVYVLCFPKYQAEQVIAGFFAFVYAPVMLSFIGLTRMSSQGNLFVWLILISAWGCDTCAYCVGKLIGKKKIFPVLSPKKSLEGCIGGVVGAALLGLLYAWCMEKFTGTVEFGASIEVAVICAVGAVMSMVGDLAASAIKRNKGIKDYGKLIPGHGGIMDRFDSVIITAPMVYFLMTMFAG